MEKINLKFDEKGLIPAIIQNYKTKKILMLGYMNEESFDITLKEKKVCFYSRSRNELWLKGETSGNYLEVVSIDLDCDNDTLLINANPQGPTCHTGEESCFFNKIVESEEDKSGEILFKLYDLLENRKENPVEGSYTNYLFEKGIDKILKKVGEENAEVIIAAKNNAKDEIIYETSDLFYHVLVMLIDRGVRIEDIFLELNKRHKK